MQLVQGDTLRVTPAPASSRGNPIDMPGTWTSSDPSVAEIDSTGLVVATGRGDALVTFASSGLVGHVDVDVANAAHGWRAVAVGCGIRSDELLCWDWSGGELTPPQRAGAPTEFIQVARGRTHACAISADYQLYCWGSNTYGQLGDGTTTDRPTPTIIDSDILVRIAVGPRHTCAIAMSAVMYCWGSDADGQLGVGGSTELCNGQPCRTRPTLVQIQEYVVAIGVGGTSEAGATCAVANDGQAFCWGTNANGILGDGGAVPGDGGAAAHPLPQPVTSGERFATIAVGGEHACAVTTGRRLYCWGRNASGQRGTGDGSAATSTPTEVTSTDGPTLGVVAGDAHTCARLWHGGMQCWGSNSAQQVSPAGGGSPDVVQLPHDVRGGRTFVDIAASDDRTCGITTNDEVVCWGGGIGPTVESDPET
jgi:hypothetical protein